LGIYVDENDIKVTEIQAIKKKKKKKFHDRGPKQRCTVMGPKEIHPFIDNRSKKGKQKNMNSQSSDHVSDLKKINKIK
jgi:hypothetical protein